MEQEPELSPEATDMLINAELHKGGRPGVGRASGELARHGYLGPAGCLTKKGAMRAILEHNTWWRTQKIG
jgi:hypothetical protein